ncbi:hypothetical protein FSP39_007690 [Pinctada imbricata]|uniref:B box-type domain-containing protein n=1 Tax=Pinctada imbricata TaxID=66713 RepID=A0AA88YK37_PINIB|nr:hypothetical protein FSP39_007690 [Pinctada imbricata]
MSFRLRALAATPTCPKHPKDELDTFCIPCGERVCESCRGKHQGHEWLRMKRLVQMVRENEKTRCKELTEMVKQIKSSKIATSRQREKEKIRRVQRDLKSMVDDIAEMMVSMVDGEDGEGQTDIPEETRKLELMLDFFKNHLREADGNVIMEMEEEFYKKKEILSSLQTTAWGVKFVEGTSSRNTLQHMFGRVVKEDTSDQVGTSDVKVNVISYFTHVDDSAFIRSIRTISNTEAWITRYKIHQTDKVDSTGAVIQERKLPTSFDDFIIEDNNDIVYTHFGDKMIRRCSSSSGTVSDVISTAPLHPVGICRSHDGGMMVVLCSCDIPQITSESYGQVYHIDNTGGIINKYTCAEGNKDKLFICPGKIAQNINLDLCVVDIVDKEFRSRLVVISVTSDLRFTYTGQPALKEKFSCKDVTCDRHGRILLADLHNHAVHLLREDGHFLQYVLTKQSPFWAPQSLGLHDDTMWVGCSKGVVRVYKYSDRQ